ncbi:bifunctional folylpolyglutamate synthase/dihydrofolate synthase [Candidatus Micrarchaeota archaeon]|nr:bifunctional folylpolyglutamate synthase/dihydrofolate synthase [Candidatus Micrarchaeota archaeon]
MDFDECQKCLEQLPEPSHWDLERMRRMALDAGLDLSKLNAVQVAGTNGKGSTGAFLESMLRHAGIKTGLYTSPHLLDIRERIQINGQIVSRSDFAALANWALPFVKTHGASQFEALTLMAFKHFLDQTVDWAVVEVGMGGKKDATSILTPRLAIITNIGLDHTTQLGNLVEQIAFEKAGIIPESGLVLTAAQGSALDVIRSAAQRKNARLEIVPALGIESQNPLTISFGENVVALALQGAHQAQNAALALAAAQELQNLGVEIAESDIIAGLQSAKWPGRLQTIANVTIDGAHNPDGITALVTALKAAHPGQKWNLIFGVLNDKDYPEMVRRIGQLSLESVQLVTPKSLRALDPKILVQLFNAQGKNKTGPKKTIDVEVAENVDIALKKLKMEKTLVCGSLYVAAEAMAALGKK